jgi:hypothetical protein
LATRYPAFRQNFFSNLLTTAQTPDILSVQSGLARPHPMLRFCHPAAVACRWEKSTHT